MKVSRMDRRLIYLCLIIGLTAFLSCKKEKISLSWDNLNSGTSHNLTAVHFTHADTGYAVGGDTWYLGIMLHTYDGGNNWQVDSIANKQFFGIDFLPDGTGHIVGIDGYLFEQKPDNWQFHRLPRWNILRGVDFYEAQRGVVVGGEAFSIGVIMTLGDNYATVATDTLDNQLESVTYSDEKTIHAVGYGLILRSTDGGLTWAPSETTGDYFREVQFVNSRTGYIIGYNGTLLKTTDAGESWDRLRGGDQITVSDKPFLAMHFVDADRGYICGEGGLLWQTTNGGEDWAIVKDLPNVDFYDVFVIEDTGYLVGENGQIVRFSAFE